MLNRRNKVKLLLIFILLTSNNDYAFDLDTNITSNYISNQLVQANNSWWGTITSFFGFNKKAKVDSHSQDVSPITPLPHTNSAPDTQNSEQTQAALNNQVNEVISTGTVINNSPNKDVHTINTPSSPPTSFINLDSNTLPKVNDNNIDIELPDLPEEIASSKASKSKNEKDDLVVDNQRNLQANINQNSIEEQQTLHTVSENYYRKYTPIRRGITPHDKEIIKLVQPLTPQHGNPDNNQIQLDFEQNDHNNLVSINEQKDTITNSQITLLQSDNSDVEHKSIPIESTNSNTTPTQPDISTQELPINTNQTVNVRDGNNNAEDSSGAIDYSSMAEHVNATADDNSILDSTDHNSTEYTQDNKELDQKTVKSNNNIYNPTDDKDDTKNDDENIINNAKSIAELQTEQDRSSNTTLPTNDNEKVVTVAEVRIANSEKIYDNIAQSDSHTEQEQESATTTIQSSPLIDKSLEQSQEQKVNTTELSDSNIVKSTPKIYNVDIDTFINEELIDLARNDNNDVILGSLTRGAELLLMDDSEYSKMIEQKLEYRREDRKLQGVNNIINYHHSKIHRSKKQKNNLQLQRQALSQASRSIGQNEINNLRTILDYRHIINLLDVDGNSLLHIAAKYNNYTLSKLLIFKGSNVDISNNDGFTPLAIAIMNNNKDLMHLLYTIKQTQQ